MRGYYGIGIFHPKTEVNVGTLWRSAFSLDALFIFTIGKRYEKQSSDTTATWRHIPLYHYTSFEEFNNYRPYDCKLIGVEISEKSIPIKNFIHPQRCIYLLGAEDHGLPNYVLEKCQYVIEIPSRFCLNVSTAGSIVMFDRINKGEK